MKGNCLCGQVVIDVTDRPAFLNLCNCEACFKLGAMWGYYSRDEVAIGGMPVSYVRADMTAPSLDFNFCIRCGATTHWSYIDPERSDRLGVNMRLFDFADLAGLEVRYGNRREFSKLDPGHVYHEPTTFLATGATA